MKFAYTIIYVADVIATTALKPWGQTVAHMKDINGVVVELCTVINKN